MQKPQLAAHSRIFVQQKFELAEWLGFETRNKYAITDQNNQLLAYAAEQGKGFFGLMLRQFLGHWRTFDVLFFTPDRQLYLQARHPFRFYYQRLDISESSGRYLGAIERRFSIFSKSFVVLDAQSQVILEVSSPLWKLWTFPFKRQGQEMAVIRKKWSGVFMEAMSDKDRFMIEFNDPRLREDERSLILAAALFIDLIYFEKKANS